MDLLCFSLPLTFSFLMPLNDEDCCNGLKSAAADGSEEVSKNGIRGLSLISAVATSCFWQAASKRST